VDRNISVVITTRYEMDDRGIESQWGRGYRTRSDWP